MISMKVSLWLAEPLDARERGNDGNSMCHTKLMTGNTVGKADGVLSHADVCVTKLGLLPKRRRLSLGAALPYSPSQNYGVRKLVPYTKFDCEITAEPLNKIINHSVNSFVLHKSNQL